jgi:hypothetical protein
VATLLAEYFTKRTSASIPHWPNFQWTSPDDAISAPVAAPLYSFAAGVIAVIATAPRSVPIRLVVSRRVLPVAGIKPAGEAVTPMPNASAATGPDKRK